MMTLNMSRTGRAEMVLPVVQPVTAATILLMEVGNVAISLSPYFLCVYYDIYLMLCHMAAHHMQNHKYWKL